MVLMMVVPLVLVLLLPKLVNQDPELQRELQQTTNMFQPSQNMPNLSEMAANFFEGSKTKKKPIKSSKQEGASASKKKS